MVPNSTRWVASLLSVCVIGLIGCNGNQGGITPIKTPVSPAVMTVAKIQSGGILPENCNDWVSPWVTPLDWWNSLRPNQSPKAVGQAAVGFEIQFDTRTGGGCSKYRQDLYRAGFTYDLSPRQNLKGLVRKAELSFSSFILPSGVNPRIGSCLPVTGGGGALLILRPGQTLPAATGGFAYLGSGPAAQPFPNSANVFFMTSPWQPGPITGNLPAGVTVTTSASGLGGASFTVDVTNYLNGALNRGDGSLAFMLSGFDEATPTVFPAGASDCKTVYKIGDLIIEHL